MNKAKHIVFLILIITGLFAGVEDVFSQPISAPTIHCIAIDSAGAATITWTIPPDTNSGFVSYNVYSSKTEPSGYANGANAFPDNQTSATITTINANTVPFYFYATTTYGSGTVSPSGDTIEGIYLSITNLGGVAKLGWNAMHTPNLPGFDGWYYIYREYKYAWTLLDSTQSLSYVDTITYCSAVLNYKIVANDASGCQSVSNRAGGTFQDNIDPASPVMDSVSVGPGNNINISWYPSSSKNVTGYYVYEYNNTTKVWSIIDTVYGINTTYFDYTGGTPGTGSESFCIAAFDSCKNVSPLDNLQHTIYLQQTPNPCEYYNVLKWNPYTDAPPAETGLNIKGYNIYVSTNNGSFQLVDSVNGTTDTLKGLKNPASYCYFVSVVDSTNHNITASSNIICYQVAVAAIPKFDYMRSATVINNSTQNQVNWYVDTGAGIAQFVIKRTDAPGSKQLIIGSVPAASHTVYYNYTDPSANPNIESYSYTVCSEDSCDHVVDSTQIGQTIYLTAVGDNSGTNQLNWSAYADWKNGVDKYDIYRDEDSGPYTFIGSVSANTFAYTDNVSSIITGQGIFGYYVQAIEDPNPYPFVKDTSTSNIAIAYQDPRLYVPNAFNPKGINKVFIPVGVFVDLQNYDFTIYNRWGQMIFETTETTQGWDGTLHGELVEEGIYIYRIQYTSGKGEYFTQRGWVMMLK